MVLHRNELVRITDLATTSDIIEDHEFEGCHLMGPAIVAPLDGVTLAGNQFSGDLDSVLLEMPDGAHQVGIIGLRRVSIHSCRIDRIGFAGGEQFCLDFKFGTQQD